MKTKTSRFYYSMSEISQTGLSLEVCLEALLFVAAEPVSIGQLGEASGAKNAEVEEALKKLETRLAAESHREISGAGSIGSFKPRRLGNPIDYRLPAADHAPRDRRGARRQQRRRDQKFVGQEFDPGGWQNGRTWAPYFVWDDERFLATFWLIIAR
jgi:5-methylcytosine-specific restriction endonuclease McrBC GTP-binding regulatory subunit McrB